MDIKSKEQRSENMAKIRSKNTKPELLIRSLLHKHGLRFRVNYKEVVGKPDLYFTKKRVAVFVHGCYWHRHKDCKIAYTPKSNLDFWQRKFDSNVQRDSVVRTALLSEGIRILVIWECTVKRMTRSTEESERIIEAAVSYITGNESNYLEL